MLLTRLLGIWAIMVVAMSANGMLRELVLRPSFGRMSADILSAISGAAIILLLTRHFLRPFAGESTRAMAKESAILVVLTVAFEFLFGHYVDAKSWKELFDNYAFWRGRLWPILLALLAATPFIWGRWCPQERPASWPASGR